eukprot:c4362_g1_i1 orf=139-360(-)
MCPPKKFGKKRFYESGLANNDPPFFLNLSALAYREHVFSQKTRHEENCNKVQSNPSLAMDRPPLTIVSHNLSK